LFNAAARPEAQASWAAASSGFSYRPHRVIEEVVFQLPHPRILHDTIERDEFGRDQLSHWILLRSCLVGLPEPYATADIHPEAAS
jgi:hypothetical protein